MCVIVARSVQTWWRHVACYLGVFQIAAVDFMRSISRMSVTDHQIKQLVKHLQAKYTDEGKKPVHFNFNASSTLCDKHNMFLWSFFKKTIMGGLVIIPFLWGNWCPYFWLMVISALGFKATVDPSLLCFVTCMQCFISGSPLVQHLLTSWCPAW